ncbi:hypothetical protein [Methanobrevibacter sp.]|uniref:hypothetical protein n=1 Tax=Methanobrevibacter sp. TaxID=66852 RepID=UPI00388D5183
MVVSLILTLCLMGVVSANENMTVNYDDTQIQIVEENIPIESIEINDIEDYSSDINEKIDDNQGYNTHIENSNALNDQMDLPINFEYVEINDMNTENMFNNKISSSNGYVTYNENLLSLPLIESDLNNDSIMVKNEENRNILFSGDAGLNTANLWNKSTWINGLSSNESDNALIKRPHITGFISNQTFYNNYPQQDLPLEYAIIGVSRDIDDAFIWNKSDENALIIVDMVNESTDNILDLNLNEELNPSYQIGVDASLKALDYFKRQGINIQKGYPYLYVLTSASYVKINETSTDEAIN